VTLSTSDLRARFEADGYVVLDSGIDPAVVKGAVADVELMFAGLPPAERRVQDAWKASENVRRIALEPSIVETLAALYGRTPRAFQTLNFRVASEQRPHADTIHFDSVPPGYMCGVWVALEDIDMDNGPVVYYPGSHKLPQISFSDLGLPPYKRYYPKYEDAVEQLVEERVGELLEGVALEPRHATLRRGQALIWSANLIHGGAPQRDPSRTRHSQVTHYFFEGFRYRTPMRSGRYFTYWRYPEWVRPDGPRRNVARDARTHMNALKWILFAAAARLGRSRKR
jgi:Phytanoyl-CoA dioxygenase (PhyH)